MNRTLSKLAFGIPLVLVCLPSHVLAGRGGGYGGGNRGAGGGGYGGGQARGGSMSHAPSFSQPRSSTGGSGSYGNRAQSGYQAGSGANSQYGAHSNAASATAGAGYANRNQSAAHPNAAPAAAGAGYANRNQGSAYPNAGAAAAGAGYANRNQGSAYPNAGAAAAGAGYANRNQGSAYPNAGAAALGAGYANNRYGTWNGNHYGGWGAAGLTTGYLGGVGAWGTGSPMYGWGYSGYSNPYYGGFSGSGGVPQGVAAQQPGNPQQTSAAPGADYSQPISTTAAPADQATAQAGSLYDQARDAFKAGDYAAAVGLVQQALAQTPHDTAMHEFLALAYFAQSKYQQAAAPLYAVLSVRPGWDWTALSGMYADLDVYTRQLRALETYVRDNPSVAQARFVLAYHYLTEGHDPEAIAQLKEVVRLQPSDTVSAQIIAAFQPSGGSPPPPAEAAPATAPVAEGKLAGTWAAKPAPDTTIALTIQPDGTFTWTATGPGKPPVNIAGKSTLADGTLTLAAQGAQNGSLVGNVAWKDANDFSFRLVGAPANDPGLQFGR
jgi:hypothetical protein